MLMLQEIMERLSRGRGDRLTRTTLGWCLKKSESQQVLKASEHACKAFPHLTIAVVPEPLSWYPNYLDTWGDPVAIDRIRRWWWGLWFEGYELSIYGPARDIQDYLRLLNRLLEGEDSAY